MGLFDKIDLVDIGLNFAGDAVPPQLKETIKKTVKTALADSKLTSDLNIILTEAVLLFKKAGENPATNPGLRSIFNDVASILPVVGEYVASGGRSVPAVKFAKNTFVLKRLMDEKNQKLLVDSLKNKDAAFFDKNYGVVSTMLANTQVQNAAYRILDNPTTVNVISGLLDDATVQSMVQDALKEPLAAALADKELRSSLDTVLSGATILFQSAGGNPTTNESVKEIFNDVASVLPFSRRVLETGNVPLQDVKALLPALLRLSKTAIRWESPLKTTILRTIVDGAAARKNPPSPKGPGA